MECYRHHVNMYEGSHGPRCPLCESDRDQELAREAAESAAYYAAEQVELERARQDATGTCYSCGQFFAESTRTRPGPGVSWTGHLGDFADGGVCPACYHPRKHTEVRKWTEAQWESWLIRELPKTSPSAQVRELKRTLMKAPNAEHLLVLASARESHLEALEKRQREMQAVQWKKQQEERQAREKKQREEWEAQERKRREEREAKERERAEREAQEKKLRKEQEEEQAERQTRIREHLDELRRTNVNRREIAARSHWNWSEAGKCSMLYTFTWLGGAALIAWLFGAHFAILLAPPALGFLIGGLGGTSKGSGDD